MAQRFTQGDRWYDSTRKRWYEQRGGQWVLMAEGEWLDFSSSTGADTEYVAVHSPFQVDPLPTLSRRDEMALRIFEANCRRGASLYRAGHDVDRAVRLADRMIEALDG